jgi:UDP-N-acetyl-2-amino-2-deoxyglucuronate dehydrogenase
MTCAIVGCGRIAARHITALDALPTHYTLICAVEPDAARRATMHVPCFSSLKELLAAHSPDIVIICSPSGSHADQIERAIRAGAHVVCEKPVAMSARRASALDALARAHGRLLVPCYQTRLLPSFMHLLNTLDRGALGPLHTVNMSLQWCRPQRYFDEEPWRGTLTGDGGVLINQASHMLDWMMAVVGYVGISQIFAWEQVLRRAIAAPDSVTMCWRGPGAQGTLSATVLAAPSNFEATLTVLGDLGSVQLGGPHGHHVIRWDVPDGHMSPLACEVFNASVDQHNARGHLPLYEALGAWLVGERLPLLESMRQGALDVARCVDAVRASTQLERPVRWPTELDS